jgi:serine O-acetyltransferase
MAKHLEVVDRPATPPVWAALRNEAEHAAKASRPWQRCSMR